MSTIGLVPCLVGVAGGTASGKTTICSALEASAPPGTVAVVSLDNFYRCHAHLELEQRAQVNYDHPDAFEVDLLLSQLKLALSGRHASIAIPLYDFSTHSRRQETLEVTIAPVMVVEGILTFHWRELRDLFRLKIFVATPPALCLERRCRRDVQERGRTQDSVHRQWESTVYPMFKRYCATTEQYADLVIDGCEEPALALRRVRQAIAAVGGGAIA